MRRGNGELKRLIIEALERRPGLSGKEVAAQIRANHEYENTNENIYVTLARMARKNQLYRDGKLYYVKPPKQESAWEILLRKAGSLMSAN